MINNKFIYNDTYETCYETFATLSIYTKETLPEIVTTLLEITPSKIIVKGQTRKNCVNAWFLYSEKNVDSKDLRRHIDWLLEKIYPKKGLINILIEKGFRVEISCFWSSNQGHGGPILWPTQLQKIADLNLELNFDFYS